VSRLSPIGRSRAAFRIAALRRKLGLWACLPAIIACSFVLGVCEAHAERRVALVMGNAAYQSAAPLRTPVADATKVGELLRALDFSVVVLTDVDKAGMELALRRFSAEIDGADVALFYYSGHAAQVGDLNYLVPVSAKIDGARSLALDTIALQDLSSAMQQSGAKVQLLFLDACRDNPFGSALSSKPSGGSRGLARLETANGSLIVFSTAPGQVARDGAGDVSPFTAGFLRYAPLPNLDIRQMLSRVRSYVATETDGQQVPWDNSSLLGDFYLVPKRPPPMFEKLAQVELVQDASTQSLQLKPPVQAEGGAVNVRIEHGPAHGRLVLGSRQISDNDAISGADFAGLAYASATSDLVDSFSYKVSDSWGNTEVGMVSIARVAKSDQATSVPRPLAPSAAASVNMVASAVSLIGLGPNLVFRQPLSIPADQEEQRLQLAADVPFGQILLGERVIEKGRSIRLSDLSHLSFDAPIGSEGKRLDALFVAADGGASEARIGIEVQATGCDRLAGDVLDAQGVTTGVITSHIDTAAALPACELALKARPNSGRLQYEIARVYAALGRDAEAVAGFHKAADLGHVRALWALGNHDEFHPPVNQERGKELLERAAAAGDVYAMHTLGQVYYEGRGVAKDLERARSLFEVAARAGHTYSMNSLGRMYQRGETVPVNLALARRYWEESAARGDIYGVDNLGWVYLDGVDVPKDPLKAMAYFKQASDLGHPEAPNNVGRLYVLGAGVPIDYTEARRWYLLGADRGDAQAALNLGDLVSTGKGGRIDKVQAGYYYARAAAAPNRPGPSEEARTRLASMDAKDKTEVLRLLLRDADPSAESASMPSLTSLAQRILSQKGIAPSDKSPDAVLIGIAQATWLARMKRADLF
jgi:TPR repeat protein